MRDPLTFVHAALHPGMTIEDLEALHLQKLDEAANRPLINNDNAVSDSAGLESTPGQHLTPPFPRTTARR